MQPDTPAVQVFLTRPAGRNGTVPERLTAAGLNVHEVPALELRPIPVADTAPGPGAYDVIVFVSRYAVQRYLQWQFERAATDSSWPVSTFAATVGASSAQALIDSGLVPSPCIVHPPADTPAQDSEALLAELNCRGIEPRRVLIVRGTQGREWLAEALAQRGAQIDFLPVYERVPAHWPQHLASSLVEALRSPELSVFLLTSSEGVRAMARRLEDLGVLAHWADAGFVALHERIGATLQSVLASQSDTGVRRLKLCMPDDDSIVEAIHAVARQAAKP